MRIIRPNLFYLFKRALGFFLVMVVFGLGYGQMTLEGNVLVIDINTQISSYNSNSTVYISKDAYVYDTESMEKKLKSNTSDKKKRSSTKQAKKKEIILAQKRVKNLEKRYYSQSPEVYLVFSTSSSKNATINNTVNNHPKQVAPVTKWFLVTLWYLSVSKLSVETISEEKEKYTTHYKIRPPPFFLHSM